MAVRNLHWYNRNEASPYPVDDSASGNTDDGQILPPTILVDMNIKFPEIIPNLRTFAFLSSLTVTPNVVSLIIIGATRALHQSIVDVGSLAPVTAVSELTPLATLTIAKPVDIYRQYAVDPQIDGVGGWVVFGHGANDIEAFFGRFSSPLQSMLSTKAIKKYEPFKVFSVGKIGSAARLQGLVRLSGGNDIEIAAVENIDEILQTPGLIASLEESTFKIEAAEIRLRERDNVDVLSLYAGPCQGRPESGTCEGLIPIEAINGVIPDCDGRITIEFQGCSDIGAVVDGAPCGVVLDCEFGLSDACSQADRLPDMDGNLPGQVESDC
jgi:hypothetical protein